MSPTQSTAKTTRPDPLDPLVHRYLLEGDEEAMDALVERTRPRLLAVAGRMDPEPDAALAAQRSSSRAKPSRGSRSRQPRTGVSSCTSGHTLL